MCRDRLEFVERLQGALFLEQCPAVIQLRELFEASVVIAARAFFGLCECFFRRLERERAEQALTLRNQSLCVLSLASQSYGKKECRKLVVDPFDGNGQLMEITK